MRIQKLFLLTIVGKVASSFLGWRFGLSWSLGFGVPLAMMATYIAIGLWRPDRDVSDEKFGDSCYYLGFVFTITSIIFGLFDLPDIATRMPDIAVRFGAAMVSTVMGLVVRVYLVGFERDVDDATREAEQAVIDAARHFHDQLALSTERLRDFGTQVDRASRETVERVNLEVERLALDHSARLGELVGGLVQRQEGVFHDALEQVRASSHDLGGAVQEVVAQVRAAGSGVSAASEEMTVAMRRLRNRALESEEILEAVQRVAAQQATMLESARGQVAAMTALAQRWDALESRLADVLVRLAGGDVVDAPAVASAPVPALAPAPAPASRAGDAPRS